MHTAKECNLNSNATPATNKPVKKPIKDKLADAITLSNALASIMETQDDDVMTIQTRERTMFQSQAREWAGK